jgi:hypothetical protein
MKKTIISGLLAALVSTTALADLTSDLSFGTGDYNGWTAGPSTYTQTGNYSGDGLGVATVTGTQTVSCCGPNTWAVSPYTGSYMVGLQPGNSSPNYSDMTSALGLSSSSISALSTEINSQGTGAITSGVWITKNFTFSSPATFKMAWNYISTDYVPFNDGSLTSLVNTTDASQLGKINSKTQEYLLLGATNPGTGNYSTGSYGSTGWQWVNYDIITAGTYKLGFAAFNQLDTGLSPVLFVNDGLGTTTQNGTAFNPVAPNDPTMPTTNPDGTVSTGGSSTPTVTGTTTSNTVTTSTTNGTPTIVNNIVYGVGAIAVTNTNSRGEQGAKTLTVTQNTTAVTTTPFTITTTTTTPVTTTTTTTPVTTTTYSDNTTTTANGTPVVTSTTANSVSSTDVLGEEVVEIGTNQNYSTRIDQYDYMSKSNTRINMTLDSNVFDRHDGKDTVLSSRTGLAGTEEKGWTYIVAEGQRSNTSDTYRMNIARFGVGHEKKIESNWIVGAQYNNVVANLAGDQSGGRLEKNHIGLYSLYNMDGWLLKSDLGLAHNTYSNYHSINELGMNNTGKTNGTDVWLANRLYTPSLEGVRPFAGVRVQNSTIGAVTESGTPLTAMTYGKQNQTNTIGEAGVRYDAKVADSVNLTAEAAQTTNNITTVKVGASFTPEKNVLGNINVVQQRQGSVVNNIVQATVKWLF